ncbi:MAG: hypothetical protein WA885_21130 [Phormidesmis sp.]
MKLFHICTISNDTEQYQRAKKTFLESGFSEEVCKYSLFDNSKGNTYDPFKTINYVVKTTAEPYVIFCHQDVLLDKGDGFFHLKEILEELEKLDPKWAIAGNAGINNHYELVAKISDSSTPMWLGSFPQKVHSLDENFFVMKTAAGILCSQDLEGFHCYASDLCLSAIANKFSCYVIDFHLTHLSTGTYNQVLYNAQDRLYKKWSNHFSFCYVKSTCSGIVLLSRYKILRYFGLRHRVKDFLLRHRFLHSFISLQ